MPQRPRSHILETESRAAFRGALPLRWILREEAPDYGIDVSVEIVTDSGEVTGRRFFAQLKATDEARLDRALSVRLKIKTFRYLQGAGSPCFLVLYHSPTRRLFGRWVHDLDVFYALKSKTHYTFRLVESDAFTPAEGPGKLEQGVDDWRWLKSPTLVGPLVLKLDPTAPRLLGAPISKVLQRLVEISRPLSNVLVIGEVPLGRIRGEIEVTEDDVHVRLFGGSGAAMHRSIRAAQTRARRKARASDKARRIKRQRLVASDAPSPSDALAADILTVVALALQHAGHISTAAQVAETAFVGAASSRNPQVAGWIVRLLLEAGRHAFVVRAAIEISQAGCPEVAELCMTATFLSPPPSEGRDDLRKALANWLAHLPPSFTDLDVAAAHYNVGRYVGLPGWDTRGGVAHFVAAARLDRSYRGRGYFWEELGALFFVLGRFRWSAAAYGEAGRLGQDTRVYAKQADALWRVGRYGDARDALEKYNGDEAHWLLLRAVLPAVIDVTAGDCQRINTTLANELTESALAGGTGDEAALGRWLEVIRADGTSPLSWFNLGVSYGASGDLEDAMLAFLIAALMRRDDSEAWANALVACILWLRSEAPENDQPGRISYLIGTAAAQLDREGLFRALMGRLASDAPEGRECWRQLLRVLPSESKRAPVIRVRMEDRTVEIPLDDPDAALRMLKGL